MQAIIMAAGKSTRTYPITLTIPKPLVKIANKPIIVHNLEALKDHVNEFIIIVGYLKEQFNEVLGNEFEGIPIKYVEQREQHGTGHAVLLTKNLINEDFLVINGDDIFSKKDFEQIVNTKNSMLVKEVTDPSHFGVIKFENEKVLEIVEKSENPPSNLANTGLYHFEPKIFEYLEKVEHSKRNEIEIVDAISLFAKENDFFYKVVIDYWLPNTYCWSFLENNEFLLARMKEEILGEVEPNVTIKGKLILGKGSIIKSGTYIEGDVLIGENVMIGPNCYLRGSTSIDNGVKLKNAAEIKNSIIFEKANGFHLSFIGDSIIGKKVNIGAGTKVANFRHDGKSHTCMVKEELIDTGRRKLGAIIGDNVHTGINCSIYPGRLIWPDQSTLPGEIVRKNKKLKKIILI